MQAGRFGRGNKRPRPRAVEEEARPAAAVLQDMTILVRGHDIATVGRAKQVTIPTSAKVIDGAGKFVIPGLWDMHSHFRDAGRDRKMDIANGVLGTRNMGGVAKEVFSLRDAIAHSQQLGPKIVACGPIIDGPNSWSNPQFTISVTTTDEARAAVVSLKQQGTDCIKVYDGLSRDSYFAILDEAKKLVGRTDVLFLDVREPAEVAASGKVPGALAIPRGLVEFRADPDSPYHDKNFDKEKTVILYCASGGRSALAGKVLKDMGYDKVYNVGGFKDWTGAVEKV